MTRKTPECYGAVFKCIEEKLFKMEPAEIMTDYEDGMRLAIKDHWPRILLKGCWFHLSRAVERRSRKLGLTKLANKNGKVVRKMLKNLPLLPADRIEEGFQIIINFAKKNRLFKRFELLFKYYRNYWLDSQVIIFYNTFFEHVRPFNPVLGQNYNIHS